MCNAAINPLRHLDEQIIYTLNRAMRKAILDITGKNPVKIVVNQNYRASFKDAFNHLRRETSAKMRNNGADKLDPHKLASIALLAVILSRPLKVPSNGPAHALNEVVGFYLAIYIIRDHQIADICGADLEKRQLLRDAIEKTETPEVLYSGTQPVLENIIFSICRLSYVVQLCKIDNAVYFTFILSSLLFYIDSYSRQFIEEISKTLP